GNRQVGAAGDVGHDVVVLAVDRFFHEHRLVGFQAFDEQFGGGRADGAVEIDGDVDIVAGSFAQLGEFLDGIADFRGALDVAGVAPLGRPGLEGGEALSY